jgi:hypothetical protein
MKGLAARPGRGLEVEQGRSARGCPDSVVHMYAPCGQGVYTIRHPDVNDTKTGRR